MGGLDNLYQEVILDHYKNRRHRGEIEGATVTVDHNNPMCGDEIHLQVRLVDGRLENLGHTGNGCSISQASASMMSEVVIEHMRAVMHGTEEADEERLEDGVALAGVRQFPARVKCALLSWIALKDALEQDEAEGGTTGGN
jgi:nitrogen fixation NifU-like protein